MTRGLFVCSQLNEEFQKGENPAGPIYAISMTWFKDWENFVRARTNGTYKGLVTGSGDTAAVGVG